MMAREKERKKLSKVEVRGFEARHYDRLMDLASFGRYQSWIESAFAKMDLQPGESVLDMGCGTGRNAEILAQAVGEKGRIVGLDIGAEMLEQARKRAERLPQFSVERRRIDEPLPYAEEFDHVLLSFVLHGFLDEQKVRILENAFHALRPGGQLWIFDWNAFSLDEASLFLRVFFRWIECPLARDFIAMDLPGFLRECGFIPQNAWTFVRDYIRLQSAARPA